MAYFSIQTRTLESGELRYKVTVAIKEDSRIIHRESKTFKKKGIASAYGKKRVAELELATIQTKVTSVPIGTLLDLFIAEPDLWKNTGRTKRYVIQMLRDCDISKVRSNQLTVGDLISHCKDRRAGGAGGATVYHDIAYLRGVMKKAHPVWGVDANYQIFDNAVAVLADMKLIAKSQKRTRRPTELELEKLVSALQVRQNFRANGKIRIPFTDILEFSILSCMRIGEVVKLRWDDLNEQYKTIIVRDRKDPRKKDGNHMLVPLLGGSFDIVMRQEKTSERIFPYNCRSVTAGFQRVRNSLGIEDLRYHDLRREGASRLFERGYGIEEVAQVTGHRNLNILWQVYTQLYPHKLHEKDI